MKHFIFDFDGTICNSYEAAMKEISTLSKKFGYRKLEPDKYQEMKELTMHELLKSLGISRFKLPFVVRDIRSGLNTVMDKLVPFNGISELLLQLKQNGKSLSILTSNSKENVEHFLQMRGINVFDFTYGGSSIFGKAAVINKLISSHGLSKSEVVYIGDETRDVEAAKSAKIPIIAVSWGFNTRNLLELSNPDFLVDSPEDIQRIICE